MTTSWVKKYWRCKSSKDIRFASGRNVCTASSVSCRAVFNWYRYRRWRQKTTAFFENRIVRGGIGNVRYNRIINSSLELLLFHRIHPKLGTTAMQRRHPGHLHNNTCIIYSKCLMAFSFFSPALQARRTY